MTTTDDTALQEQIEVAILEALGAIDREEGFEGYEAVWVPDMFIQPEHLSAAVLPIIRAEVTKAQARALRQYADALERNGSRHAWDAHHFVSDVREWADYNYPEEEQNDGR